MRAWPWQSKIILEPTTRVELRVISSVRARRHLCPWIGTCPAGQDVGLAFAALENSKARAMNTYVIRLRNETLDSKVINFVPILPPPSVLLLTRMQRDVKAGEIISNQVGASQVFLFKGFKFSI